MAKKLPAAFTGAVVCPGCARLGTPAEFVRSHRGSTYAACPTEGCGYEWSDDEQAPTLGQVMALSDGGRWDSVDMPGYLRALLSLLGYEVPDAGP